MSKPKPIPEALVCSECGLDWDLHPENPRRRDCIKLLQEHRERITTPQIWWNNDHYCNWGHRGCWLYHQRWWNTNFDISSGMDFTTSGEGNQIVSNVFTISGNTDDDDPDMGVPAKVS